MRAVGLKVLKNKLREYVRLAASGETVLVTDGDKVVAELVPPRQERSLVLADVYLAEAVRKGWVTPPTLVSSVHHLAYPLRPWLKCFKASTRTAPSGDLPRHVCDAGHLLGISGSRIKKIELATYDQRMLKAAEKIGVVIFELP